MGHHNYSDFLFAHPSVLSGVGRVLDLGGTLTEFNTALTPEQADAIAIAMDWQAVGADLNAALGWYRNVVRAEQEEIGSAAR